VAAIVQAESMARIWNDSIRARGRLRVFPGTTAQRSAWRDVVERAVTEFNRLSRETGMGVLLERVRAEADAEVLVETALRGIAGTFGGQAIDRPFDGTLMHGRTLQVLRDDRMERALVFLPAAPQLTSGRRRREAGPGVKLFIAVHELIHACGLSDAEHSNDDVFMGYPQVDAGSRPADDRVRVTYERRMPPLQVSAGTAARVRALWS
jgi:hypothetical protein